LQRDETEVRVLPLPTKLSRYAAVVTLLLKHRAALEDPTQEEAEQLARDLEKLGPTFVKLGQLLSTRADLLPPPYLVALSRLQDDVAPFSFAEVERIVESELGVRISKGFGLFEAEPIAAASLGQVHRAALRDGRLVAVKVQRPDIDRQVTADLQTLAELADFIDRHAGADAHFDFSEMVAEFRKATLAELDYRNEAANLRTLAHNVAPFNAIVVPLPIEDYTTSRVLTMDYVLGTKVTALSPLTRLEVDGERLGRELVRVYLHQIIVDGFFHADPHPGNVFLTDDGRLALVDLGMVGRLSPRIQERLLELLLGAAEGRPDETTDMLIELGQRGVNFDEMALRRDVADLVARYQTATLADLHVGRMLLEINQTAAVRGLKAPSELTMLGKTLLNLDHVARALAPDLDVNATIREQAVSLMRQRMIRSVSPGTLLSTMIEAKHFAERLPGRVNRVLDALAGNELRLKVEMIDEGAVIDGLQKVANRIALGLVLASLIVAAAVIMQVPTTFRLFGYPALAMILFLIAATGGAMLAIQIVTHDRTARPERR
jgi:predicted unusual protein kinase regulating ubiquinone biosynthesis (AarF/ABC1/UbiB family)